MPLDLSHPRTILPFANAAPPPTKSARSAPLGIPAGRPAIQLKLSEDVLAQLVLLARSGESGGMRIDLSSSSPAFIVNGVSYPLNLSPEPAHTEVVCLSPDSRNLVPIALLSHKASLKPGVHTGALAKVSLSLRENREQTEKDREGRCAVLLDSAPSSRSSSHSRVPPRPTSRLSSPATPFSRPPSRLSAVPNPPPPRPAPPKPPTSSFRIGKGSLPPSLVPARSTSSDLAAKPTVSPPTVSPARQGSSSSGSSNGSSLPHISSSTRTSLGSPPARAGGGGVLEGKDSLKKAAKAKVVSKAMLSSSEEEGPKRDEGKKKRKLLNGISDKAPTPISSPRPVVKVASPAPPRKTESPAPSGGAGRKRGRKIERDYSSSEDDGVGERRKRRATGEGVQEPSGPPATAYTISSRDEFGVYAQRFGEEWVGYSKLWKRLEAERRALEGGNEGEFDLVETDKLVKRCEKEGRRLRGIKRGLEGFVRAQK